MSDVVALRHIPTYYEAERRDAATRKRSSDARIRREIRRERLIEAAARRLHMGGVKPGWVSLEMARISRNVHDLAAEARARGFQAGYRYAASFDTTSRHYEQREPRRAEWERREVA